MEEHEYTIVINVNLEDMQDTDITDRESLYEFMEAATDAKFERYKRPVRMEAVVMHVRLP